MFVSKSGGREEEEKPGGVWGRKRCERPADIDLKVTFGSGGNGQKEREGPDRSGDFGGL